MRTYTDIVGECPIGKIIRIETVDMFGFLFDRKYEVEYSKSWNAYHNNPFVKEYVQNDLQMSYSDYVYYSKVGPIWKKDAVAQA